MQFTSKLIITLLFPLVSFANSTIVTTQTPTPTLKLGVVDTNEIIKKINLTKKVDLELEKNFKPRLVKLEEMQKKVDLEAEQLKDPRLTLEQKIKIQEKYIEDKANFEAQSAVYRNHLDLAKQEAEQKLLAEIAKVVGKIVEKEQYTFIFQKNNVAYVAEAHNITPQVIAELNK